MAVQKVKLLIVLLQVAYVVIFHILWLMFMWTYTKIVLTPPGFARDVWLDLVILTSLLTSSDST